MNNIEFTIKNAYGMETYFMKASAENSIEMQIDDALAEVCYCDAYELIRYRRVSKRYVKERKRLIKEYERKYGNIEEEFPSGKYTSLKAIRDDIEWRKADGNCKT